MARAVRHFKSDLITLHVLPVTGPKIGVFFVKKGKGERRTNKN